MMLKAEEECRYWQAWRTWLEMQILRTTQCKDDWPQALAILAASKTISKTHDGMR